MPRHMLTSFLLQQLVQSAGKIHPTASDCLLTTSEKHKLIHMEKCR